VCVNPLYDATYHVDRNWYPSFSKTLIDGLLAAGHEVSVIGGDYLLHHIKELDKRVKVVQGNFKKSIEEAVNAKVYIGGDTGLTHLAAISPRVGQKIISVYGHMSPERHKACRDSGWCGLGISNIELVRNGINIPKGNDEAATVSYYPKVRHSKDYKLIHLNKESCAEIEDFINFIATPMQVSIPPPQKPIEYYLLDKLCNRAVNMLALKGSNPNSDSTLESLAYATRGGYSSINVVTAMMSWKNSIKNRLQSQGLYYDNVRLIVEDYSVYLQSLLARGERIDVFYSDLWQWSEKRWSDSQHDGINFIKSIKNNLNNDAIIILDANMMVKSLRGLGDLGAFIEQNFRVINYKDKIVLTNN
jgi:hypothetical protein